MLLIIIAIILVACIGVASYVMRKAGRKKRAAAILVLVLALLTLPISLPWAKVGLFAVKCGHLPVIGSNFAAGYDYTVPGNKYYASNVNIFTDAFFCNEDDAKQAGYHKSSL